MGGGLVGLVEFVEFVCRTCRACRVQHPGSGAALPPTYRKALGYLTHTFPSGHLVARRPMLSICKEAG